MATPVHTVMKIPIDITRATPAQVQSCTATFLNTIGSGRDL
jgi:hypothetical protein